MPPSPTLPQAPPDQDRRLYRRYPTGLEAELVSGGGSHPCRVTDISLGGAAVELGPGVRLEGGEAVLRSPQIAMGFPLPVVVMRAAGSRVSLAFAADEAAEHELTMFLLDSPATQETIAAVA